MSSDRSPSIHEVIEARLSRRDLLRGAAAATPWLPATRPGS